MSNRFFLLMLMVLMVLNGYGQSAKSDELYAKGVELYRAGMYQEAIPLFQMVDSLDKVEMDTLDGRRYSSEHWITSCYYRTGDIQKAKDLEIFTYEMPPIDRRLVEQSDLLTPRIELLINNDSLREALVLSLRVSELEEHALGGETWYSLNTKSSRSYILSFLGRHTEAEQLIEYVILTTGRLYGNDCRILAYYLRDAVNIYKMSGNVQKIDEGYQKLISFLSTIGEQYSDFAEKLLEDASGVYAQIGNNLRLDQIFELQMQLTIARYGENSIRRCNLLRTAVQLNMKLGRTNLALQQLDEGENLAKEIDGKYHEMHLTFMALKVVLFANTQRFKEARRVLRESMKAAQKLNNSEVKSTLLSMMVFLWAVDEGKIDEDLLTDAQALLASVELTENNRTSYAISSILIAEAFALNGRTSEGADIVQRNMPIYKQLNQFNVFFSACLVFLLDHQYVNARKSSSKGLELLNSELKRDYAQVAVNESRSSITNGLTIVERLKRQEGQLMADTTAYSLSMIQQDLLQAKLYILSHSDSLGTEEFMTALGDYARTAYLKTQDTVMGDSIVGMYSRRLADTFGSGSPQYAEAIDLKERCRFEDTVDGHIKAFRITLATPGTALYEQFCREYEEAYVEWKGDGGNKPLALKADDYRVYDVPHTLEIMKNRNYQTVADSCQWAINKIDNMLKARDSERDEKPSIDYLRKLMAIWALCADSSGRRSEVVTQAQSWYRLLLEHGIWNSKSNLLQMLATAKISGDAKDYDRLEASVADTIRDSRDELRAATLLQALYQLCDGVYLFLYNNTLRCSLLAELDQTLQQLKSADSSTYAKYLLLRTGLVARNIWEFGVTASSNKESLTAVLELLEKETDLHVFSESHGVVSLLCGEFFSLNDYESVVRSDRLRKKIAKVCDSDTKRRQKESLFSFNLHWQSFSPLGKDFELQAIYTNLAYGDADKLEEHIQLAYNLQNEKSEITSTEQQEALLAQWNDIRSQQRNAFSDDEKLVKKIEDMTTQACRYLERQNVSDTICGMAYNIALFGKGYLLRSHQQLRHVISESGNRTVLRDLDEYIRLEQLLDNSSLSQAKAEEMTAKANDLWQKLRSASTSFDDYSKSLEADWHDVRNALAPDELAIEYVCTNDILKKYYALILRKDYEAPLVLGLSYESTYTENPDTMFTQEGRYRSPWPYYVDVEGKYVHPFEGIRRVYVSPTGVLHKLPLESLHDLYTDSIMSDKFEIYRVTSTRELIGHHRQRPVIKAQLYGGVTYSMDDNQWQLLAATKDSGHKLLTAMRDVPKLSRGAVSEALQPLEGTEREVREIAAMLGASSDDVTCLTGADATEDNLKSLSGSGVTVLHIATHGFYQTIDEASDSLSVTFARSSDKQEANALSRSGLFMAGAAAVFSGDPIPDNVDDGVLTAREISHLDLTSLDMLALSACETALGDTSGEGVFGLQRGFKKAGAQSILMSLWKVDDEATCLLMTEFYKHWIGEGKTKHDALELAKQTVRSHKEKGWDNPEYWAAFILLDGLE